MYANDTELHFIHSDFSVMEKTVQADMENVFTWLIVIRLKLNLAKSLCMLVGSRQKTKGMNLTLTLDGAKSLLPSIWVYI